MTRQSVTDDQYGRLWRRLKEIARRVDEGSISLDKTMDSLQLIVEGKFNEASAPVFVNDKTKDGWILLEHASRRITSAQNLELVSFLKRGENSIGGEEMVRRARVELDANYGQEDAEWLLDHQDEIPVEFRKYYLVFTGTVWRDSLGRRLVPYLVWDGGGWCLRFGWLAFGWRSDDRLVRLRK